jgi:lipid A 3-O-deacylase
MSISGALALLGACLTAQALELGVRIGTNLRGQQGVDSQEVYVRAPLPYVFGQAQGWHLRSYLEGNAGRLSTRSDSLAYGGVAGSLWLGSPASPLSLGTGTGPTYLSQSTLGNRDFGGPWQFTSHAVVQLTFSPSVSLAYRVQHTSNADLYSPNDGIDIQALELRLRF